MSDLPRRDTGDPFKSHLPTQVPLSSDCLEIVDRLNNYYSVEVTIPAETFDVCFVGDQYLTVVEGQGATSIDANCSVRVLEKEFGLYPRSLVRNTRLTRVVLCGEIFRSQKPNPEALRNVSQIEWDSKPLYFKHEPAGGLPDVVNGILYLPIGDAEKDADDLRKMIHHEFYHCIQWQQFGCSSDPEWESTNRPDFVYGPGGIDACYNSDSDFWTRPTEEWGNGFLNLYCMSAPEEDQAEIFAHLMTEPARVQARLGVDEILQRKVDRLKTTLREFCRDVNDQFWERVSDSRSPFDW